MKTKTLFLFSVLFCLVACGKYNTFNPERKIASITESTSMIEETLDEETGDWIVTDTFSYGDIIEIWNWDGDKIANIQYESDGELETYAEFRYDGDKLQEISFPGPENGVMKLEYHNKKLVEIKLFVMDRVFEKYNYKYKGGKISEITVQYMWFNWDYDKNAHKNFIKKIDKINEILNLPTLALVTKECKGDHETETNKITYEWYDDNVVIEKYFDSDGEVYKTEYNYDNKKNPFNGFTCYMGHGGLLDNTYCKSANNTVKEITTHKSGNTSENDYSYTYDGDWPLTKTNVIVNSNYYPSLNAHLRHTTTTVTRYTYTD